MHPDDAAPPGGRRRQVTLANELEAVQLTAKVTADVVPGTVLAPGVWWSKLSPDGRNVNRITAAG
ncbi:MAG: molybdopterin dinucleotide binding domain-containing protein [Caldilineaceae bacterium]